MVQIAINSICILYILYVYSISVHSQYRLQFILVLILFSIQNTLAFRFRFGLHKQNVIATYYRQVYTHTHTVHSIPQHNVFLSTCIWNDIHTVKWIISPNITLFPFTGPKCSPPTHQCTYTVAIYTPYSFTCVYSVFCRLKKKNQKKMNKTLYKFCGDIFSPHEMCKMMPLGW